MRDLRRTDTDEIGGCTGTIVSGVVGVVKLGILRLGPFPTPSTAGRDGERLTGNPRPGTDPPSVFNRVLFSGYPSKRATRTSESLSVERVLGS